MNEEQSWKTKRIDELGRVHAGRQRSPHFTGGAPRPYLRVANIFDGYVDSTDVLQMSFTDDEFERYRLSPGDLLLNEGQSLELVGRCAMYEGDPENCCFQNTLVRFRANDSSDSAYMLNLFRYLRESGAFETIASQTTSIAHLGVSRFARMKVLVPCVSEQRAIDRILVVWDRAIEQTERLIATKRRRKQALMQQLLTGKDRFRQFGKTVLHRTPLGLICADWPVVHIREAFSRLTRTNTKGVTRVLTASGEHGLVDQRTYFNRSVAGESLVGYYLLRRGEFAYNRSLMKGYPYGAIKRLDLHDEGVLSTLYLCFTLASNHCDSDFFAHLFEGGLLNSQLREIAQVGARAHGLLNVTAGDFLNMKVPVPSLAEQKKISQCLNTVDGEINVLCLKLDALKRQKKGLMQQLLTGKRRLGGAK